MYNRDNTSKALFYKDSQRLQYQINVYKYGEEAEWIPKYDFLVINDDLDECVDSLHNIISSAHNAPVRQSDLIDKIKKELEVISKGE